MLQNDVTKGIQPENFDGKHLGSVVSNQHPAEKRGGRFMAVNVYIFIKQQE